MGRDIRQEAFKCLLNKVEKQGYVIFDDIMDCADAYSLSIQDFDWLSSAITTRGIIVYDIAPKNHILSDQEDYNDYAQSDYEAVYNRIIELDNTLEPLIAEIRNIKPPQRKEFSQIKYQVLEGNQHARNRMIEMHLRIAVKIALQRAEAYDTDIQDSISEAFIGLITAVDKYEPDTNGAFGSYASMWVLQNISRNQPTQRALVYYPVHKKDSYFVAYPLLKTYGYIGDSDLLNNDDVREFLHQKLSFTNEQTDEVLLATIPFVSFEEYYSTFEENNSVCDKYENSDEKDVLVPRELISDVDIDNQVAGIILKEQLTEVLGTLSEKERKVLVLRYGLDNGEAKTLEDVGKEFNVTRERIRQIEVKALRKLRHPSRGKKLRDYLDFVSTIKKDEKN